MSRRSAGFALIAVLWALVLVGGIAGIFLAESRHLLRASDNRNAELRARQAALAGLARAQNGMERLQAWTLDPATQRDARSRARTLAAWNHLDSVFAAVAQECLGTGCVAFRVRDAGSRVNVNRVGEQQLESFFRALGIEQEQARVAAASIAERNGPLASLEQLRRIPGVDAALFARAAPYLTVEGEGTINLNTAPLPVLAALPGMSLEMAQVITDARADGVIFTSLFDVWRRFSADARARLPEHSAELLRVASFEPQMIEVTSVGSAPGSPIRVAARAVYRRVGERVVEIKRSRPEPSVRAS
jgi:general secretion pathway protein K